MPATSHSSSHPSLASLFSPFLDTDGGASFLCLPSCRLAVGAARSSLLSIGLLRRLVVLPVSVLIALVAVRLARPSSSVLSCSFPSLSSCVMPWSHLIISSSHRSSHRSLDTAGGERGGACACGVGRVVFVSARCAIITPRFRLCGRAACFVVVPSIVLVPPLVLSRCPFRFSSSFAPSYDTVGGEVSCGGRPRACSSLVLVACRAWDGAACPHGVLSSRVVLAVGS